MAIPYTPDAVAALRHAAVTNTPIAEVQRQLGWDGDMLAAVCRKHGIDIVGAIPATPQTFAPVRSAPPTTALARLRTFANGLPGISGIMLQRLIRSPLGERVPSEQLGVDGRSGTSCKNRINKLMREAGHPFAVEGVSCGYRSGYRLVRIEDVGGAA